MELILAGGDFKDIREVTGAEINMDLGDTNDFEFTMNRNAWETDLVNGNIIYIPGSEYGGIFGGTRSDTGIETFTLQGRTWRGMLQKKIIEPPEGQAYRMISGELNNILGELVEEEFPGCFYASKEDTGVTVINYQMDRYCTLLKGIEKLLKSVDHRLRIRYLQRERGLSGYVEVAAVPIEDYSEYLELSQDAQVDFICEDVKNGVNHLICLGKGELTERTVIHLYVQQDGTIGHTQYYTGLSEVVEIYENTNAETDEDLEADGIERLREVMNYKSFEMDVSSLDLNIDIGDIVGGRDYLTGLYAKQPITGKLLEIEGGKEKLEYRIEGDDGEDETIV